MLTFAEIIGSEVSGDDSFGAGLWMFVTSTEPGTAWAVSTALAAVVSVLVTLVRGWWWLALATVVAVAALVPIAGLGHQGGTADHTLATSALFLHLLFAAVWVGGLAVLAWLRPVLDGERQRAVVQRYSTVALVCFGAVALSGLVSAGIRTAGLEGTRAPTARSCRRQGCRGLGASSNAPPIRRLPSSCWFWWIASPSSRSCAASGVAAALSTTPTPSLSLPRASRRPRSHRRPPRRRRPRPPPLPARPGGCWCARSWRCSRRRGLAAPPRRPLADAAAGQLVVVLLLAWSPAAGSMSLDLLFSAHMIAHMVLG